MDKCMYMYDGVSVSVYAIAHPPDCSLPVQCRGGKMCSQLTGLR